VSYHPLLNMSCRPGIEVCCVGHGNVMHEVTVHSFFPVISLKNLEI
jgi:hypothetical protein